MQEAVTDESEPFRKEFANLHHQLKALSSQQPWNNENEKDGMDESLSMHDMANECSKLVKKALDEKLHREANFGKLQSSLIVKDHEIEDLHAKVSELSVSQNVVLSFFSSQIRNSSDLSNPSVGVENGLQSVDESINRMLTFLAPIVDADDGLSDKSITGKMSLVEQNVTKLNKNHQNLLSEIELFRQSLTEMGSDFDVQEDLLSITAVARNVSLEFKRKEVDFDQKISKLEEENKKVNVNVEKLEEELEEEKTKYANTKEKLSIAVAKGKALVQQRDTLKQSLAEKTSEVEQCLAEIEEKSQALEIMNLVKEDLVKTENLAASLQETVSQRDTFLAKCEEILDQTSTNHQLGSIDIMEKIRFLIEEKNTMASVRLEFNKLGDILSSVDFPETLASSDLESRVSWLVESYYLAESEAGKLQDEIARSSEVAQDKIEHLTVSLLDETKEKNYIREELEGLTQKYQEKIERESQLLIEKNHIVSMLLEAFQTEIDGPVSDYPGPDMGSLVEKCFAKMKALSSASNKSSGLEVDVIEKMQTQLYLKVQELMLCEELLEEDTQIQSKVNTLEAELRTVSQELQVLRDEKSSLEKDLESSDEKTSLLREKLSMAVKKGKGLAQDRENSKKLMDEKNTEIGKLQLELQQKESTLDDSKNQINKLSTNVELIPKLELDLTAMKDQKDQLQQSLIKNNNMMQRMMESIESVVPPVDETFNEPIDKVLWLVRYLNECQDAKTLLEQDLGNVKLEVDSLSSKLTEAYTAKSSLEEALSNAENSISQLGEEKRELSESSLIRKSLEDALAEAEAKLSVLSNDKNDAQISKAAAEMELEKVKEEVSNQTTRLSEAYRTINSLKDALSQVETNVSLLSKENNGAQVDRNNLEEENKKLKEEAESQASKFFDATTTIRSFEDNLSKLDVEKKNAEDEISLLSSKLNACMEDLSGLNSSKENKSMELSSHLNNLELLSKDKTLSSLLRQNFEVKFHNLRDMDLLLRDIKGHLVQKGSDSMPSSTSIEEGSIVNKLSAHIDNFANGEIDKGEGNAEGGDSFESHFEKAVEGTISRYRILADDVQVCSTSLDEFIASLLKNLQEARDEVVCKLDQVKFLEQKVKDLETDRDTHELKLTSLEKDVKVLFSVCTITAQELENEAKNYDVEMSSAPEEEKWNNLLSEVQEMTSAENLLMAAQKVCATIRLLNKEKIDFANEIQVLENKMIESKATAENAIAERDLLETRLSMLENDLEVLRSSHIEMSLKVEDNQAKEAMLSDREAEISSLHESLTMKEKEAEDAFLIASQVTSLCDKINDLEIPITESEMEDTEIHEFHLKKLFFVITAVTSMQREMNILSQDKEKLQSTIEKQAYQIKILEEKEEPVREKEDLGKIKNEMYEVELGMGNIIDKLGGNDSVGDRKPTGVKELFTVLEKLVTSIYLEYNNTKFKAQELSLKLQGSQKRFDELSAKIKMLEASSQGTSSSSNNVEERSIFGASSLPARSEITELENGGSVGKKAVGPAPSAHARTLHKGSSDHLAISIDSESDRLIKDEESDEDKGKVFKSLNTSGLIPKQGKMVADRVDGFWVSGDRALMSRPRVRLGFIAYWLLLHLWVLGTIF